MTTDQRELIDRKFQEIDEKLKDTSLNENEVQLLLEERAEYEEQSEELDSECKDDNCENEEDIEYVSLYFKYWFEGCKTIDEVLLSIERLKQQFVQWKNEGHELTQPVDTGYCFIDKISDQ